ncbi:LOW QUALITY PROTEIN: polycystin-1-like protein 3 [Rhynchonycteris naso]
MFFKRRTWLWLYIRTSIILGSELNSPEQHGKNNCYQLNRFHYSFKEAENYCHAQGGHLTYTWNQEVQDLIWDFLEEGKKWIGQNLMLLGKYQEKSSPNVTACRATKPSSCTYMSKKSSWVSEVDLCLGHYFICRTVVTPWASSLTSVQSSSFKGLLSESKTLCHSVSPFPSVLPGVAQQRVLVQSAPSALPLPPSQPLPVVEEPTPGTRAAKALPGETSSPKEAAHPDVPTPRPHTSLQSASDRVSIVSEKLLKNPFQNNSALGFSIPVTVCPPHSLLCAAKADEAGRPGSKHNIEQVENILKMSLLDLGRIQETFLQQNQFYEPLMTMTSFMVTLILSSKNLSALPLSTYTLQYPAPVRGSASALAELLNKYPGVNIQITGLAFNPFRDFDDKNIVGSIGSVLLSSNHKLQVNNLTEDIGITPWRNADMETHPTSINMSTDHFTVTVNATSPQKSLIVSVGPESPISVTLYLGFQYQPNHTHFHLNITFPKAWAQQKDEEYTWVLTPGSLQHGVGLYYIMAVRNRSQGAQRAPTLFSFITSVTRCYFWDSHNSTWRSSGCQVGPQSSVLRTQCLCNHLTFFGSSFFIVPRTVNIEDTVDLFLRITNNPVGIALLASLLGFLVCARAWRKDRADMQKVKVTVLADNDPSSRFHYLIQVSTGYGRRASTTAKVVITLYGSEGLSEPHQLSDPQKAVLERGGLDVFLLGTRSCRGDLHSLRLWLDNTGVSPAWYVNQVIVSDVAGNRKWHFLYSCWLAVDLGDCERDRVFIPVSKKISLFSFRHLFSSMIMEKFTQDYLWLSIATQHPWNQFTIQRLTCCMTLLLCNMLVSVMFWKISGPTAKREEPVGPFAVTWSELLVSIQTAVILFPISLVIGRLFPLIQPQDPRPSCLLDASFEPLPVSEVVEELKETVGFLLRRRTDPLSVLVDVSRHGPAVVPENHHHFCCHLLRVIQRLQSHVRTLGPTQVDQPCDFVDAASQVQKLQELLQTQVLPPEQGPPQEATSFSILSAEEGRKSTSPGLPGWLTSICWLLLGVISLATAFLTALYSLELNKDQATSWVISMILSMLQNIFNQPVKVILLSLLLSLTVNRMPGLSKGQEQEMKRILALSGFVTDGNSFLLGNVLLRQIHIAGSTVSPPRVSPQEQGKPSHQDLEDTENCGFNWRPSEMNHTESDSIWHYQSQETLAGYPIQGGFSTYSGGGYIVRLGRKASSAIRALQHLEQSHWLDRCTKSLFVEFVVFNANVNLFCAVTLILESNHVGALFTSARLDTFTSLQKPKKDFASVISQVIYLLVCYYGFIQGCRLKRQRCRFFTRKKNILDMSIVIISFGILGLDMKLISLHKKKAQYHHDRDRFISFQEAVKVNSAVIHLMGFLVPLGTVQLWNLLHCNPRLWVTGRTLNQAWGEVVGFLLVILILLTGYAIAFNLLFGWSIYDYWTVFSSVVTFVGLLIGIFHHKEIIALDPILGSFPVLTSVLLIVLVIINLFVSVILMSFGKERKALQTWKEAALTDVLLQRLSSLFGIQRPRTPVSAQRGQRWALPLQGFPQLFPRG